jgi:hypothetical protein
VRRRYVYAHGQLYACNITQYVIAILVSIFRFFTLMNAVRLMLIVFDDNKAEYIFKRATKSFVLVTL